MKILSTLLAAALFAFASCTSDKAADANATTNTETTTAAPAVNTPATGTSEMPAADPNAQMQTIQPAQQPAASGDVAMNPAHGQPNHRCDIPVGAPLNSPPSQPQATQVQ